MTWWKKDTNCRFEYKGYITIDEKSSFFTTFGISFVDLQKIK